MLSQNPSFLNRVHPRTLDNEILRLAIIAELDAINAYEQLASSATSPQIAKLFSSLIKEEKTHVGELQALLLLLDKEQAEELSKGAEEVKSIVE